MTSAPPTPIHQPNAQRGPFPPTGLSNQHRGSCSRNVLTAWQNQLLLINNSYSVNICTAKEMDGSGRRRKKKKRAEIAMGARGAAGVTEHAPRNQFSHRRTIRLLRSGMTDHACVCVCVLPVNDFTVCAYCKLLDNISGKSHDRRTGGFSSYSHSTNDHWSVNGRCGGK